MATTTTESLARLVSKIQDEGLTEENARRVGRELAGSFGVQEDEVGILQLEGNSLVFCHPAKLKSVGKIPLNSSSSVASRTASTRRPEIINNFPQVKHTTVFEAVDLSQSEEVSDDRPDPTWRLIQKLISAPVMDGKKVRGVIQISRKGPSAKNAGTDFSADDLRRLVDAAAVIAPCFGK